MAHAHNVLIRGLNSVYQQASNVTNESDVRDFLSFTNAWIQTVEHHHDTEEATMFPKLAAFTQNPDIMAGNLGQHEAFQGGLHELLDYIGRTDARAYSATTFKGIVDGFAPALIKHLHEEITTFLALEKYDSQGLLKVWKESEEVAKGAKNPHMFVSRKPFPWYTTIPALPLY